MAFNRAVVLVCGGASGLGWATAARVAKHGGYASIIDLPSQKQEGVAKIKASGFENIDFYAADITSIDEINSTIKAVVKKYNRIDLGVQTAGIGVAYSTVSNKMSIEKRVDLFRKCVSINTVGTFNFVSQLAEQMSEQEPRPSVESDLTIDHNSRGVIVCTASIAAMDGQRGQAAYSASKGGIVGMTLPIARDLAKYQVRINTIAPGLFDTPLLASLPEKAKLALAASVPHPSRLGNPDEFAALVEHVLHNPMMNAETIRLDGALRMNM